MESVYTLLNVDRGVPEVWGSKYDVRELLRACYYAIDKKPITDIKLSFKEKELLKIVMKKVKGTDIELLLKEDVYKRQRVFNEVDARAIRSDKIEHHIGKKITRTTSSEFTDKKPAVKKGMETDKYRERFLNKPKLDMEKTREHEKMCIRDRTSPWKTAKS